MISVEDFFRGKVDKTRDIIKVECSYNDNIVYVIYRDLKTKEKRVSKHPFYPFLWCKTNGAKLLFGGNKDVIRQKMKCYNISAKRLLTNNVERLENGYNILFYSTQPMCYSEFLKFFEEGGCPIYNNDIPNDNYITISPSEQYMIQTNTRLFANTKDYNSLNILSFSIEKSNEVISKINLATNNGKSFVIENDNELDIIIGFFKSFKDLSIDVVSGYNAEDSLWKTIEERVSFLTNKTLKEFSEDYFPKGVWIAKEKRPIKIGEKTLYHYPVHLWGYNISDTITSIRKNMAINTSIFSEDINYCYELTSSFNREKLSDAEKNLSLESFFNSNNFYISKLLPMSFEKALIVGSSTIWTYIMLSWSFQNDIAIPIPEPPRTVIGGLSKLFISGVVGEKLNEPKIAKLDYNSCYPSILLSLGESPSTDISNVMLKMLNIFFQRKCKFDKEKKKILQDIKELEHRYIKQDAYIKTKKSQLEKDNALHSSVKTLCNTFHGALSTEYFYWNDYFLYEKTTCTGRNLFRKLLSHFKNIGNLATEDMLKENGTVRIQYNYKPIVGDSFTGDTPLIIKYIKSNLIDIKPIEELLDENQTSIDDMGREYDFSEKNFTVLSRKGFVKTEYIYRHKTDKDIYSITDDKKNLRIDVTSDHSLFNIDKDKITPKNITEDTQLEYYNGIINHDVVDVKEQDVVSAALSLANGETDRVPLSMLNTTKENKMLFYKIFMFNYKKNIEYSKTCLAGLLMLKYTT